MLASTRHRSAPPLLQANTPHCRRFPSTAVLIPSGASGCVRSVVGLAWPFHYRPAGDARAVGSVVEQHRKVLSGPTARNTRRAGTVRPLLSLRRLSLRRGLAGPPDRPPATCTVVCRSARRP